MCWVWKMKTAEEEKEEEKEEECALESNTRAGRGEMKICHMRISVSRCSKRGRIIMHENHVCSSNVRILVSGMQNPL